MNKVLRSFSLLVSSILTLSVFGQINYGGEPFDWSQKNLDEFSIHFNTMPIVDMDLARAQDEVTDAYKETPYRFGIEHDVDVDVISQSSEQRQQSQTIYRFGIHCPEAISVSLLFSTFNIPKGDQVFIYNAERSEFLGSFNHKNQNSADGLAVGTLKSDRIIIEYIQNGAELADIQISQVIHGYRAILNKWEDPERGPFGNSGACNINVICPEGDQWQVEKKSVALIVSGGNAQCTGALVNNTAQDGTPYFLTANHCLGNPNNWVFYFNHEATSCGGNSGPSNQSVSGAVVRANNGGSDFALLELNDTPPAGFDVQYVGWDRSDLENVTSAVGIHHPSGDVKKICFENDSPYHDSFFGTQVWWIDEWEDGVTEGGSSGSPLFNQNHQVIGQLFGGQAACQGSSNNGQYDYYGRFGVSWNGSSAATRLRDWLDPLGTSPQAIDGWPIGAESFNLDGLVSPGNGDVGTICGDSFEPIVNIVNQGANILTSATITFVLNGDEQSAEWTGSLEQYQSEAFSLGTVILINGTNNLEVSLSNPNGNEDENDTNNMYTVEINAVAGQAVVYEFNLTLDDYGTETTWSFTNDEGLVLYEGGPYQDDLDGTLVSEDICLGDGCYTFTILDDYDDGICCNYGDGSYELLDNLGDEVTSGGEFETSESADFCVGSGNSLAEQEVIEFNVYPNPNNGTFSIEWAQGIEVQRAEIMDGTGRIVKSLALQNEFGRKEVNANELAKGIYFIRLLGENYSANQRIIVR